MVEKGMKENRKMRESKEENNKNHMRKHENYVTSEMCTNVKWKGRA